MKIAICCIAYNRIDSLKRLINSLERAEYGADKPTLIISIDKSDTNDVEKYAKDYFWKFGHKIVYTHLVNLGLREHVLECGKRLDDYDAMIVLEDDITVTPFFYQYALQCVEKYSNDNRVAGISLYNFPVSYQTKLPFNPVKSQYDVFMMNCAQSWGQVWMKNQWKQFEKWYEDNSEEFNIPSLPKAINSWPKSSWLKYHTRYCIEQNKFFVYPYESLSTNNNDVGTHVKESDINIFQSSLQLIKKDLYRLPSFDECTIKYDGFFEPLFLDKWLQIDKMELCVDLFGQKDPSLYRHYLLSKKHLPYKVVKSFGLILKPIEANIGSAKKGNDLFLYDISKSSECPSLFDGTKFIEYIYGFSLMELLHQFGYIYLCKRLLNKFTCKVKIFCCNS